MPAYKVSYKVLGQQGEELKALAKQVDGYSSRVDDICRHLGNDKLLSSVRQNLKKLSQQLDESRNFLNKAGEIASRCVEGYQGVEVIIVKKVDSTRAHNRDFYKNPVAVASAGGGAPQGAAASAASYAAAYMASNTDVTVNAAPSPAPTIEYTDNSTTNYNFTTTAPETAPAPETVQFTTETPTQQAQGALGQTTVSPVAETAQVVSPEKIAAAGTAVGAMAAAGGIFGTKRLRKYLEEKEAQQTTAQPEPTVSQEEDPEELLKKALQEAEKYKKKEPEDKTPKWGG